MQLFTHPHLPPPFSVPLKSQIGDLPTRFKYTSVPKENFGLDAAEILLADDMQLNELISLKKLAPYRRYESVAKDMEKFKSSKKKRIREFRRNLIEQVEAELEGRAVAETAAAASTLASSSSKKKSKKHADGAVASLANATLLKEKQIKSTMSKWLERIKDKRAEGQTPADVEEHKKKVRKEKKRKRAEEHRQKQQQVAAATINGDTAGENVNKKPKVSADRLKTYGK